MPRVDQPTQPVPVDADQSISPAQSARVRSKNWREQAQILRREVWTIWLICKDPRTPWYARLMVACAVGYVLSPVQLIPSFIPVIGFLDDFLALSIGYYVTRRLVPDTVIRDCRERAVAAQEPDDQNVSTLAGKAGAVAIMAIWVLLMIAATVWLYRP